MSGQGSLWDNPPVSKDMFTPEQLANYERCGEHMYGGMDFSNMENSSNEAVAYTVVQLKSGLHPSYLSDAEKELMLSTFGENWEQEYGTYFHF